ncbi:S-methyl-5'-thioadenosine phosphorylase [Malassezia furfur]|uniref:S-methyl-5'-thioadenosine phosphorylase n=1 Tax=Malassezia furfur TaxID=55194 RepID=A0ABY8EU92_MALFU|nr:MEU1 [Malassezia furfur]WFD49183.1 S-methyl-5'-thioadenosine phosphorylase [Malassezia furfur]
MAEHEPKAEWDGPPIYVGVIGGSGLYKLDGIEIIDAVNPKTPWGYPSSPISIARTEAGTLVAFLARHGLNHSIAPSHVPSTANIAALKHLGVRTVLAFSAVGSLREEIAPKDFVIPSQIIDRTKGVRRASYFGEGEEHAVIAHATFGDPYDTVLSPIVEGIVRETLAEHSPLVKVHANKTVVCMEGPAFSTRAESNMYRQLGGDIINMSALPEAKLAREAELSYVLIATSTDYDAWRETAASVSVSEVMESLRHNVTASQVVTRALIDRVSELVSEDDSRILKRTRESMKFSIMTPVAAMDANVLERLRYILPWLGK